MSKYFFPFLLAIVFTVPSHSAERAYLTEAKFFKMPWVVIDEKEYHIQFFSGRYNIGNALKSNPAAHELIQEYNTQMTYSNILLWGGLIAAIAYMRVSGDDYNQGVYWGIFGTGLATGIYQKYEAEKTLRRAFTIYNRSF
ncbi:MAG: hypothetical protein JNL11_02310 [Bdellovibrionaceae bacterium]|nr:hypothetical protein [Pseudobdellovibrionaceae bacterium]